MLLRRIVVDHGYDIQSEIGELFFNRNLVLSRMSDIAELYMDMWKDWKIYVYLTFLVG